MSKISPPRVLISGYYGMNNAGDELILYYLLRSIPEKVPRSSIIVLSGNCRQTRAQYGVRAVNRKNPFAILWSIINSDIVITGGGGIFQDATSSLSLYYYAGIMWLASIAGKKTVVYAVGVAPMLNRFNRAVMRTLADRAGLFSVRNDESSRLLRAYGCSRQHLAIISDPVCLARFESRINTQYRKAYSSGSPCVLGMILRGFPDNRAEDTLHYAGLMRTVIEQCAQHNIQTEMIPFHKRQDRSLSISIQERIKVKIVTWNNVVELTGSIQKYSVIISSRLHGLIIAWALGIPCIGIAPSHGVDGGKVERFMHLAGYGSALAENDLNPSVLVERIAALCHSSTRNSKQPLPTTTRMRELLDQHHLFLNNIFN